MTLGQALFTLGVDPELAKAKEKHEEAVREARFGALKKVCDEIGVTPAVLGEMPVERVAELVERVVGAKPEAAALGAAMRAFADL